MYKPAQLSHEEGEVSSYTIQEIFNENKHCTFSMSTITLGRGASYTIQRTFTPYLLMIIL